MAQGAPVPPDPQQGPQPPGTVAIEGELPHPPQPQPQQQPAPPQPQQAPPPPPSSDEQMLNDPAFSQLPAAVQQRVRSKMQQQQPKPARSTDAEMLADPAFSQLPPSVQQRVRSTMARPSAAPGVEHAGLQPQFKGNLDQFREAARAQGFDIGISSGYRTSAHQKELWDKAVQTYGSEEAARHWVAPPGRSMHNHGLAADLTFGSPAARQWAHDNAAKYGLGFPMGHEPWHVELTGARGQVGPQGPPPGPTHMTGAPPPAPPDEEEDTEEPEEEPTDEEMAPKSTFGNIYYRTIGRAAGAAQAYEYKLGLSSETPRELAQRRFREGGAPVYPTDVPHGFVQNAFTVADLLAPAIDVYAPEVAIPIYGLAGLFTHLSNKELAGDITEAVLGGVLLGRDIYRGGAAFVRQVRRAGGVLPAVELTYREAQQTARAARSRVAELWTDHGRVRAAMEAEVAAKRAEAAAAQAQQAAAEARAKTSSDAHAAATLARKQAPPSSMAVGDVHHAMDLPPDMPDRVAVGEQLQQLEVGETTPAGTKEGGARAVSSTLAERTKVAYAARDAKATEVGITISNSDGSLASLKADIEAFVQAKLPTTFSAKEKKLMAELSDLLGVAVEDEAGQTTVHGPFASAYTGEGDDRIPFAHLSDLYARLAKLRPAYGSAEFDAYTNVVAGLKDVIIALEGADPEVSRLGSEARVFHGAEQEFNRWVKKGVMGAKVPEEAAAFVFPMGKKVAVVSRAKRIMLDSAATQQEAYRFGWWRQLIESATDKGTGMVDLKKLRQAWGHVPEDLRTIMSADSTSAAATKLNELLAEHAKGMDVAAASDKEIEAALSTKDLHAKELREAEKNTERVLRELEQLQDRADRYGTTAMGEVSRARDVAMTATQEAADALHARPAQGGFGQRAARRYAVFAAASGASLLVPGIGPAARLAALGGLAWWMMKRPLTAAESMRTLRDTTDGARLAALIAATSQGWRGTTAGATQPAQRPPQAVLR